MRLLYVDFDTDRNQAERWRVEEIPVVIVLASDGRILLRADGAGRETLRSLEKGLERALEQVRKEPR